MVPWSLFFLFSLSLLDVTKGDEEVVVTKRHKSRLQPQPHNEWVNGPDNYLYQFHVGQQSWMAAREYCLTQNSDLVAIRSNWQRDWILAHYVPNGHPFHERLIQVGLLAQGHKVRSWSWIDGREENGTVSWISGEPFDHSTDGKEMCAVMRISDGLMDDVDCEENDDGDQLMRFICERSTDRHQLQQKSDNYLWSKIEAMLEFFGIKSPTETQKSLDKIGANETVPDDYIDEVEKLSQQERFELANLRLDNQTIEDDKEEEEVLIEEISKTLSELSNAESILREPKEKKREEREKPTATMVEITSPKESKNEDDVVNVKGPEVKLEESLPLMRAGYAEEKDKARGLGTHKKSDVAPLRELDGEGSGDHGEIEKDDLAMRVESMLQHSSDTSKLEAMIAEMERALTDIDKKREVGWREYKEALNTTYQQFQKQREKSEETEKEVKKKTLKEQSKEVETKEEVITEQPTIQARTTQKVKDSGEKEKKAEDTTTAKPKEEKEKEDRIKEKEEEEKKEEKKKVEKEEGNVKTDDRKEGETKEKTVFDKELIIKAKQAEIELAQNLITSEQLEGDFDSVENKEMPSADFSPEDDCDEEEEDSELEGSGITPITKEKEKQIDEFLSVLRQFLDRSNRSDIRKILNETDHSKSLLERMKEALKKANDAEFERLAEIAKEKENGEKMKDMDKKGDDMMETKEKEEIMKKMEEIMMDTVKEHTVTVEETPSTELLTPGETVVEVTIGKENHEDTTTSSESKKDKEDDKEKENKEERKDENKVKEEKEEEKEEDKENVKEEAKEQTEESKKPSMEKTDVAEEKKVKEEEKKPNDSVKTTEVPEETKVEKKEENTPKKKASKKKSKKVLKEKKESEQSSEQKKNIEETENMPRRKKLRNSFEKRRADALKRKEKREEKYKKKREGEEKETEKETETTTVEEEEKEDNQAFVEIRKDEESVERREKEKKERKQKRIAKKKKHHKKKEGENEEKEKKRKRKHRKPIQQRPVQVPVWKEKAEKELLEDIYNGEEDAGYQSDEEGESEERREVKKKTDIPKQSELKKFAKAAAAPKPKRMPTREIPEYEGFVEEIKEEEHTKKKETPKNTMTPQQRKAVLQKQAQHKKDLAKAQKAQEEFEKRMDVTSMMKKIGEQMSSTDLPPPPQPSIQNILSFQNPMIPTLDTVFKNLGDNFKKLLTQQNFA